MSVTARALWYIESHLDADLRLEAVADVVGVSQFHLSRSFAGSTGVGLSTYVRTRRLSLAAKLLAEGAPDIFPVALGAGYESHEAFTRAFKVQFGCTPEEFRRRGAASGVLNDVQIQEAMRMDRNTNGGSGARVLAAPRVVERGEILIFGLGQHCPNVGNPDIPSQWNRFLPFMATIEGRIASDAGAYGVIHNSGEAGEYDYICGVAVSRFPAYPEEFTKLRVAPQTYAVFEHREHVAAVPNTWRAIWEVGLTAAGCKAVERPAFEYYGPQFDGRTGLGGFEIWVPVEASQES